MQLDSRARTLLSAPRQSHTHHVMTFRAFARYCCDDGATDHVRNPSRLSLQFFSKAARRNPDRKAWVRGYLLSSPSPPLSSLSLLLPFSLSLLLPFSLSLLLSFTLSLLLPSSSPPPPISLCVPLGSQCRGGGPLPTCWCSRRSERDWGSPVARSC